MYTNLSQRGGDGHPRKLFLAMLPRFACTVETFLYHTLILIAFTDLFCVWVCSCGGVRGQLVGVRSLLPPCKSQRLN